MPTHIVNMFRKLSATLANVKQPLRALITIIVILVSIPLSVICAGFAILLITSLLTYIPAKKYDDAYFHNLSTTIATVEKHQTAAFGLSADIDAEKDCFPTDPGMVIALPPPFSSRQNIDHTLSCSISYEQHVTLSTPLSRTDFDNYVAKAKSVFQKDGFQFDEPAKPYDDTSGYTEILRGDYPQGSNTCITTLTYYTAAENPDNQSHLNTVYVPQPALDYYLSCTRPAKDTPPDFGYDDSPRQR